MVSGLSDHMGGVSIRLSEYMGTWLGNDVVSYGCPGVGKSSMIPRLGNDVSCVRAWLRGSMILRLNDHMVGVGCVRMGSRPSAQITRLLPGSKTDREDTSHVGSTI